MKVSLQGYNANYATFLSEGNLQIGKAVSIKANNTVGLPTASSPFIGVLVSQKDGYALVQTTGCITATYIGTAPALGLSALASDTSGNIIANDLGAKSHVVAVDTTAKTATFIL